MDCSPVERESVFAFLEDLLQVRDFPDYSGAWNGVQVQPPRTLNKVAVAVDASLATIQGAVEVGADLLLVHHGLFWDPDPRLVGPRFERIKALLEGEVGVYAVHLPLDAHPEVGNAAELAREVGVHLEGRFGEGKGVEVGWWGVAGASREAFHQEVARVVQGPVRLIPGGPAQVGRVGVVTGAGGNFIRDAAEKGLDTLLTGEGPHHTFVEAMEYGVNVLYAGHYATETWGVKAVARRLEERFGLPWHFVDVPSGL
ncbi:MAG: Nif3-like dinuclear metal center hexameric protein [Gemmatimonadales bacterium]|nr:MAG: Nif3-like dinuclear metal center hexameric protein [Gemmatimonadales bacterium]